MTEPWSEPSIGESLRFGWARLRERPSQCLWVGAITFTYNGVQRGLDKLFDALLESFPDASACLDGAAVVSSLAIMLAAFALDFNIARASLGLARSGSHSVPLAWPSSGWVTYGIAKLMLISGVVLGLPLGIVPGLVVIARYPFAGLLVADRRVGAREALGTSARLTQGVRWTVLGFCLACVALNVLGLACLIAGVIVTRAITIVAFAHFYDVLRERERRLAAGEAEPLAAEVVLDTALGPVSVGADP